MNTLRDVLADRLDYISGFVGADRPATRRISSRGGVGEPASAARYAG
jgi:hypothetical protein